MFFLEKLKVESEAQRIMLRHEISCKNEQIEKLTQETRHLNESHKQLQQQIRHEFDKVVTCSLFKKKRNRFQLVFLVFC